LQNLNLNPALLARNWRNNTINRLFSADTTASADYSAQLLARNWRNNTINQFFSADTTANADCSVWFQPDAVFVPPLNA
jgi:hypothetical protein